MPDAVPQVLRPLLSGLGISRIPIMCVEFSPDGRYIASGSFALKVPYKNSPGIVTIWNAQTGQKVLTFENQLGIVLSLAYSPDGRHIASSSINPENTFVISDAATGKIVKVVRGHQSQVHRLRYSPDGRLIVASDTDGTVKLWDAGTRSRSSLDRRPPRAGDSAWRSPPTAFISRLAARTAPSVVWETATGKLASDLVGHTGSALGVAFSRDGKLIASAGVDKTIRLWDVAQVNRRSPFVDTPIRFGAWLQSGRREQTPGFGQLRQDGADLGHHSPRGTDRAGTVHACGSHRPRERRRF